MYRKINIQLQSWKQQPDRKPLILLGARQVGKTWIMKEFGAQSFDNVAYLNCDEEPMAKQLFVSDYNIQRILLSIQAITGQKIEAGKTLLILDEIQEAPRALHCLKYFCENAPEYHVIAAGSLLGVSLSHGENFPVGKVNMLKMQPMDFEEFLMAMGEQQLHDAILNRDWALVNLLESKYDSLLRQYYFVGGMPEVVADYIANKDLTRTRSLQSDIIDSYKRDISKHATKSEAVRIGQVLDSIPSQLTKENKKFIYGVLKDGARATQYEMAIQWLIDAGIVVKVPRVKCIKMPLKVYEDIGAFKLFLLDCGLFGQMADAPASMVLTGANVFEEYKGAFTEQYVLQQLCAMQIHPYYWSNDRTPSEIDFVVQREDRVVPIEVKAEVNVRSKSMSEYIKNNPDNQLKGVRFSMKGYVDQGWMENYPLYSIFAF